MTVVRAVVGSIVLAASGASAGAQSLAPGMWTGTLKVVGGPQLPVEFVVDSDDSSQITMKTTTGPIAPVTDVRLNTRGMVFQWTVFACALNQKKAGQYEGMCRTADGTEAQLALGAPDRKAQSRGKGSDVVTGEEILKTGAQNVYDALARLRSRWLRSRDLSITQGPAQVRVYIDNQPVGDIGFLKTMDINAVKEARYYSPSDATTMWGTDHTAGVIVITLRRS